jgi:hypothetical protein
MVGQKRPEDRARRHLCTIGAISKVRTFQVMVTHTPPTLSTADQVFLTARQVFSRYGWGKSKGYEILKSDGFPNSIGGKYRLDSLIRWEERLLDGGSCTASSGPDPEPTAPNEHVTAAAPTVLPPRARHRTRGAALKRAI